jgi:hypothetical protein
MPKVKENNKGYYSFECPGCGLTHNIPTEQSDSTLKWQFNGDVDNPTFSPSLLNRWGKEAEPNFKEPAEPFGEGAPGSWSGRCHLFITNGQIQFCQDSTNALAGKTVEMAQIAE